MIMNVGQLVVKKMVSLPIASSIREVAQVMRENDVSSVVLTNERGEIVAIVTERDITRAVADGLDYSTPAGKIGKGPVISVDRDLPLFEALELMGEKKIRHLLVKDKDQPLGIVSLREIANTISLMNFADSY